MQQEMIEKIRKLAQEVSDREGCLLYDVEFVGSGRHRTLRILIEGKESQVSIDQCANVSRGLSLLLDVEDLVPGGAYDLEVSSPGVERSLREPWHYRRVIGQTVQVVTNEPVGENGQMTFRGTLTDAGDELITITAGEKQQQIALSNVKRAKVVFETIKTIKNDKKGPRRNSGKG